MKRITGSMHWAENPNLTQPRGSQLSHRPAIKNDLPETWRHGDSWHSKPPGSQGFRQEEGEGVGIWRNGVCVLNSDARGCHGNASTLKNKHPAKAGFELRRVHNKFQLLKLIAHCLL